MSKTTVIYHSTDYDGIFCREIAKKFLPDATLIGWNFGDEKITFPEGHLYILDLSPECLANLPPGYPHRLIWIDHHKTSIEKWDKELRGYRIDGVAACRLTWQWFQQNFPDKLAYVERKVKEPLAVRLAGEYDIWDKRDSRAECFQYAMRAVKVDEHTWNSLLNTDKHSEEVVSNMLIAGTAAQIYSEQVDESVVRSRAFRLEWEGLTFLCLNSARFNSLTFKSIDHEVNGHVALMGFNWNGKVWSVSLYHAKDRTDLDLSKIAVKYGGGGHKGACGFTCDKLPFM